MSGNGQDGTESPSPAAKDWIERRTRERVSVLESLGLVILANVGAGGGLILDLGENGISIQLAGSMPMLAEWHVEFVLHYGATPVQAKALTVWRRDGVLGLRFIDFEAQFEQLSHWLAERYNRRRRPNLCGAETPALPPPRKHVEIKCEEELACKRVQLEMDGEAAELAKRRWQKQIAGKQHADKERTRVAVLREARIACERETARHEELEGFKPPAPHRARSARPSSVWSRGATVAISTDTTLMAVAASLVVLLAYVGYATRPAWRSLSPGVLMNNGSVKPEVRFKAGTITPSAAIVAKFSPVVSEKSSSAIRSDVQKSRANERTGRRRRQHAQNDSLEEEGEVVVRHFQTPRSQQPRLTAATVGTSSAMDFQGNLGETSAPEDTVGSTRKTTRWQRVKSWFGIFKHHDRTSQSP
jgi:hypothetical protein